MTSTRFLSRAITASALVALMLVRAGDASAQPEEKETAPAAEPAGLQPFGANLFLGNFGKQREDGLNPEYRVMPGDRVAVNTWGAVNINDVFVVDGQGNIFLPGIGPVALAGVRNADLTRTVRARIATVYRRNFDVYTNLLTAAPVAVFVTGGVSRPGRYAGVPSDSILFFLDRAGGIDPALGSYRKIEVHRAGKLLVEIDLYDFILHGKLADVQFADGDTVLVQRRGPTVTVEGEVATPAIVELEKTPIVGADALVVMPTAANATGVTVSGTRNGAPQVRTMTVAEFRTAELRDGDEVVFRDDDQAEMILVRLEGEFKGPAVRAVKRGSRLVDLLNFVRVDPALSDVESIHVRRSSVARAQKKSIEESLFRLERSALLALSATEREASIRVKEAELMKNFIESARTVQPLGRVVTSAEGKQLNMLLADGDVIVIPARTNVVRVGGEVQLAHAMVYRPGMSARDYIRRSGGYTKRSDAEKVIILHASAEVTMGGPETPVRPGDEILVPPRVDRKLLQNAADITQVIYQIAVAAAVVLAI